MGCSCKTAHKGGLKTFRPNYLFQLLFLCVAHIKTRRICFSCFCYETPAFDKTETTLHLSFVWKKGGELSEILTWHSIKFTFDLCSCFTLQIHLPFRFNEVLTGNTPFWRIFNRFKSHIKSKVVYIDCEWMRIESKVLSRFSRISNFSACSCQSSIYVHRF